MRILPLLVLPWLAISAAGQSPNTLEVQRLVSADARIPFPQPWPQLITLSDYKLLVQELGLDPRLDFARLTVSAIRDASASFRTRFESDFDQRFEALFHEIEHEWLARKQDVDNYFASVDRMHEWIQQDILVQIESIYDRLSVDPKEVEVEDTVANYLTETGMISLSLASNIPGIGTAASITGDLIDFAILTVNSIEEEGKLRPVAEEPFPLQVARFRDAMNQRFQQIRTKSLELRGRCLNDYELLQTFGTLTLTPGEEAKIRRDYSNLFADGLWRRFLPARVEGGQPELVERLFTGYSVNITEVRAQAQEKMRRIFLEDPSILAGGLVHVRSTTNDPQMGERHYDKVGLFKIPLVLKNIASDGTRKGDALDDDTASKIFRCGLSRADIIDVIGWESWTLRNAASELEDSSRNYETQLAEVLLEDFQSELLEYFTSPYIGDEASGPPSLVRYGDDLALAYPTPQPIVQTRIGPEQWGLYTLQTTVSRNGQDWSAPKGVFTQVVKRSNTITNTPGTLVWHGQALYAFYGSMRAWTPSRWVGGERVLPEDPTPIGYWLNGAFTYLDSMHEERVWTEQAAHDWEQLKYAYENNLPGPGGRDVQALFAQMGPERVAENDKLAAERRRHLDGAGYQYYWNSQRWWSFPPYRLPEGKGWHWESDLQTEEVPKGKKSWTSAPDDDRAALQHYENIDQAPAVTNHRGMLHFAWTHPESGHVRYAVGSGRNWSGHMTRTASGEDDLPFDHSASGHQMIRDLRLPVTLGAGEDPAIAGFGDAGVMVVMLSDGKLRTAIVPHFYQGGTVNDASLVHYGEVTNFPGTPVSRPALTYDWERGTLFLAAIDSDGDLEVMSIVPGSSRWTHRTRKSMNISEVSIASFRDRLFMASRLDGRVFVAPILDITEPKLLFMADDDARRYLKISPRKSNSMPPLGTVWNQPKRKSSSYNQDGFPIRIAYPPLPALPPMPGDLSMYQEWQQENLRIHKLREAEEALRKKDKEPTLVNHLEPNPRRSNGRGATWKFGRPTVGGRTGNRDETAWYTSFNPAIAGGREAHSSMLTPLIYLDGTTHDHASGTPIVMFSHSLRLSNRAESGVKVYVCGRDGERLDPENPLWESTRGVAGFEGVSLALGRELIDSFIRLEFEFTNGRDMVTQAYWIVDDVSVVMP